MGADAAGTHHSLEHVLDSGNVLLIRATCPGEDEIQVGMGPAGRLT